MAEPERAQFLMARPRVPTDEAARFVENRVIVASQPDAIYSERSGRFITLEEGKDEERISAEMWQQADEEKEELFKLMEQVRAKFEDKSNSSLGAVDLRRCKWEQVMQEVRSTELKWKTSPRRTSRAMQCLDKLGRNSEAFESWLELLPAGDYGSIIAGVFTIAVGAAGRYQKVEDTIFQALEEIPDLLENARRYVKIYANIRDQFLERRTFDLFRSILRTLTHIMRFFKESTLRKISESILKQGTYKEDLIKGLEEVRKHAARIQTEANQCLAWRMFQHDSLIQNVDKKADQGLQLLLSIVQMLQQNPKYPNQLSQDGLPEISPQLLLQSTESGSESSSMPSLMAHEYQPNLSDGRKKRKKAARALLELLHYNPSTVMQNVETCLRQGGSLEGLSLSRAAAMASNEKFIEIMGKDISPTTLLVNGHADLGAVDGLSPLSFVAAKMAHNLEQERSTKRPGIALKFFCALNPPYTQPPGISAPKFMMASLVGQLLTQMMELGIVHNVLSILTETKQWERLSDLHLSTLCKLFEGLVAQVPKEYTFLIIVDEVSKYEIASFFEEVERIIRKLVTLVTSQELDRTFKLLVTCQSRAIRIGKFFGDEQTIELASNIEADDGAGAKIASMRPIQ
ncbi:hypothetical protein F5Y16DRAFT_166596 [Xylariaceae sp. FL0255]|nr:hypothetical protein F5Y16DRAFT_166596 [Xylariaceae sp. FL0255]